MTPRPSESRLRCEVCGAADLRPLLRSRRLDGPLLRCGSCGLVCVGRRGADFTFSGVDAGLSAALGARVDELGIVDRALEEDPATRAAAAVRQRERVARLRGFAPAGGTLLDVGCSAGDFLEAAAEHYRVRGVEPDPATASAARRRGLEVTGGAVEDLPPGDRFDVVTLLHVIEHLDSPRAALEQVGAHLRPGGVLFLETPTVANLWFALSPTRWRQLIPDHYWFFSSATLGRLLASTGFTVLDARTVGRTVSVAFALDRLRRAGLPGAARAGRLARSLAIATRELTVDPGDILQLVAVRT